MKGVVWMIQEKKEYQEEYFFNQGYTIYESLNDAAESFMKMYNKDDQHEVIEGILNDTNADWIVLNSGRVAVSPLVFK